MVCSTLRVIEERLGTERGSNSKECGMSHAPSSTSSPPPKPHNYGLPTTPLNPLQQNTLLQVRIEY